MKRKYSKKRIIALSAFLGFCAYELVGTGMDLATKYSITKSSYGYNNRVRDEEFNAEFNDELNELEKKLLEKTKRAETEITYDIYVSPLVKSFFDDAGNPKDNNKWAKEVENAVSGLETFRQYGIEFNLRHASALRDGLEQYSVDTIFRFVAIGQETKPGLTFIVLPVPVSNQDFMSRMFKLELAWTDINGSYALIYMTGTGDSNKHTFAHETGHMMGLPHREYNKILRALDPFNIIRGGLMMQGNMSLGDYSLNEEEIAIIEKAKERF
ncbi:MAG: hypothetical protein AABX27_04685 [Nanoarchaeota archaeon]